MTITHIPIDYPPNPTPRYGWGKPVHAQLYQILNRHRNSYMKQLQHCLTYLPYYQSIPRHSDADFPNRPAWINGSLPGLDAVTLYSLIAQHRPQYYMEIGVGNSTKFAKQAIVDHQLNTWIIGIDPYPMPGIEQICNQLISKPLEELDLGLFDKLQAGDILFVDNSHRVFMNSDVTIVFLEVLPRLKSGVMVEFHDIAWPLDYPPQWAKKYYSEQYLLAAYLLAEGQKLQILLPNAFISLDEELRTIMAPLWRKLNGGETVDLLTKLNDNLQATPQLNHLVDTHGSSFWLIIQ